MNETMNMDSTYMLSRTADSLFWYNRYMERSYCVLRVLHVNHVLSFDQGRLTPFTWKPVLSFFCAQNPEFIEANEHNTPAVLKYMILDSSNPNSVKSLITRARENARGVQDQITKEVWEQTNLAYHTVLGTQENILTQDNPVELMDQLLKQCYELVGVQQVTMPRGEGWNFMQLGRFTERALLTTDIYALALRYYQYRYDDRDDILHWRNLLLSLSGYEMYLKKYFGGYHPVNVLDMVLLNPQFPHSLQYCLKHIGHYLELLVESHPGTANQQLLKFFGRIRSRVEFSEADPKLLAQMPQFLSGMQQDLIDFTRHLYIQFFQAYNG